MTAFASVLLVRVPTSDGSFDRISRTPSDEQNGRPGSSHDMQVDARHPLGCRVEEVHGDPNQPHRNDKQRGNQGCFREVEEVVNHSEKELHGKQHHVVAAV